MRKHRDEIKRFANSEEGTGVWYKHSTNAKWRKNYMPTWNKNYTYIVDDKFAKLRKEHIDTGRPIQVYNIITSEWEIPPFKLQFDGNLENYRLKPEEDICYYYKWERLYEHGGGIDVSSWLTDEHAEKICLKEKGWRKMENSKRTWEN